jgi:lysozyme
VNSAVTIDEFFDFWRPHLKAPGFTPELIVEANALAARLGIKAPANDNEPFAPPAAAPARPSTYNRGTMAQELIVDEGERLKVYRCTAGKLTIGIGRNLDDVGIFPHETTALGLTKQSCIANGITKEQSRALFATDLDRVDADLDRRLPWWRQLDPVRQRVLVNMAFNLGIDGLCKFKNTLGMIRTGNYAGAAAGMLHSLWAKQVGKRAGRLSDMMRKGVA